MAYYAQDSAQFVAWKQLTDPTSPADFTTETLYLAAQYEAFRVWGQYVRKHGNLKEVQARELIQVVIDGWIFLQVARQIDSDAAAPVPVSVDYQLARIKAKEGVFNVLGQILEYDVARLLHHFDRFLSYKAE